MRNQRMYASEYSALIQGRTVGDRDDGYTHYLGQLRADTLFAQSVVITDSQLFDGRFFLTDRPRDLLRALGSSGNATRVPLKVRIRRATLESSLAALLERSDSEYLNPFPFNAIRDSEARSVLAKGLGKTHQSHLQARLRTSASVPKGLAALLRDIVKSDRADVAEDIDRLERGWSLWLELDARAQSAIVERWRRAYRLHEAMNVEPIQPETELFTDEGRELLNGVSQRAYRSDVEPMFATLATTRSPKVARDLQTIYQWYTDSRHRAFARQHNCNFARTVYPDQRHVTLLNLRDEDGVGDTPLVEWPEAFSDRLATLSRSEYMALVHESTEELHRWWLAGDRGALQKVIERVESRTNSTQRSGDSALLQIVVKLTAATISAAYLPQWSWLPYLVALPDFMLHASRNTRGAWKRKRAVARIVECGLYRLGTPRDNRPISHSETPRIVSGR
jgi:hypothetical protein